MIGHLWASEEMRWLAEVLMDREEEPPPGRSSSPSVTG
jgi:hypothetical protein